MKNKSALVQFLQSIVQIPSLAGGEGEVVQRVAAEMRALGYDRVAIDEQGNLIGVIQGAQPGPTLLFDAHCDTVGVAPGVPWQMDPYSGVVDNGRLHGRGSSDMKGALAAMVYAAAGMERDQLAGSVVVSISVMEEVIEGVALAAVMAATQPDFVVIGESTDLDLNHGGRGRAEIHLETIGRPSHSSAPHLGVNAVHLMLPAIQAIDRVPLASDPLLGEAIMALTDIISEPYPAYSVTPSRCRVTYDRRLLLDETAAGVLADLRALPELEAVNVQIAQGEHTTYTGALLTGLKFFPAWKLAADHPFVQTALAGLRAAGLEPGLGAYRFCTNAAYSAGVAAVPTVGFGPSTEGQAHVIDEYLELEQLFAARRGYRGIIEAVNGGNARP